MAPDTPESTKEEVHRGQTPGMPASGPLGKRGLFQALFPMHLFCVDPLVLGDFYYAAFRLDSKIKPVDPKGNQP